MDKFLYRINVKTFNLYVIILAFVVYLFQTSNPVDAYGDPKYRQKQSLEILQALVGTNWIWEDNGEVVVKYEDVMYSSGSEQRVTGNCYTKQYHIRVMQFADPVKTFRTDLPYLALRGTEEILVNRFNGEFASNRKLFDAALSNDKYIRQEARLVRNKLEQECKQTQYLGMRNELLANIEIPPQKDDPESIHQIVASVTTIWCGKDSPSDCRLGISEKIIIRLINQNTLLRVHYEGEGFSRVFKKQQP